MQMKMVKISVDIEDKEKIWIKVFLENKIF